MKKIEQKPTKNIVEIWKDMRLEVYQQASGNRHESNYSDDTTKMFSLNDIDEIIEKMSEQNPTDEEMVEALRTEYEKDRADAIAEMQKEWSEEDEVGLGDAMWAIERAKTIAKNENDMGNLWYAETWLKSLKDRVQPQPKQEENKGNLGGISSNWSEEDNKNLEKTIWYVEKGGKLIFAKTDELVSWLKSLKDRYTWKPSDEQLEALKEACDEHWEPDGLDPLYTLYQELKKLK